MYAFFFKMSFYYFSFSFSIIIYERNLKVDVHEVDVIVNLEWISHRKLFNEKLTIALFIFIS